MADISAVARRRSPASLKDLAAQEIRQRIFSGDLRPGSKVDQDTLAEELGISKLPVREALISLGYEGLIDQVARRGAFVAALTPDDIRDHYTVFGMVSGLAAQRAAENMTPEWLAELERLEDQMEAGSSEREQESLNFEFHRVINHASGARRLISILGGLSRLTPAGWFETHEGWAERSHGEHRDILAALKEGDGAKARELTEAHFAGGGDVAVSRLEQQGFWRD